MPGDTRHTKYRLQQQRQEDLRAFLSERLSLGHVLDTIDKIENEGVSMEAQELQARKIALEAKLKLMNKYLPDLKNVEMKGDVEHSGGLTITWKS